MLIGSARVLTAGKKCEPILVFANGGPGIINVSIHRAALMIAPSPRPVASAQNRIRPVVYVDFDEFLHHDRCQFGIERLVYLLLIADRGRGALSSAILCSRHQTLLLSTVTKPGRHWKFRPIRYMTTKQWEWLRCRLPVPTDNCCGFYRCCQ